MKLNKQQISTILTNYEFLQLLVKEMLIKIQVIDNTYAVNDNIDYITFHIESNKTIVTYSYNNYGSYEKDNLTFSIDWLLLNDKDLFDAVTKVKEERDLLIKAKKELILNQNNRSAEKEYIRLREVFENNN